MNKNVPIISVTGTKGKTTTVAVIADVLQALGRNVLKVDTTGHFINGERKSTLEDSKYVWGLVPSVCPGRYLYESYTNEAMQQDAVAVLECSLGCSAPTMGLGYRYHDVGVFLNVFEDHIGSSKRINSKADIATAKDFIFARTVQGGSVVFNADDEFVVSALSAIPEPELVRYVPVGMTFEAFDVGAHLAKGGVALTVDDAHRIVLRTSSGDEVIADLTQVPWTFNGKFVPSVWNMLSAVGALYAYFGGELPADFRETVEAVRLDKFGGRLTLLQAESGTKILADYAHEKVSLSLVGDLAAGMTANDGRVIGVVRLAHDRTDALIAETGRAIASHYDAFIVYDKIDGYWRKPNNKRKLRFPQKTGYVSQLLSESIRSQNPHVERIIREDEAITKAAEMAGPNDVVVVIVNDDIARSIEFIKRSFKADFI